MIQEMRPLLLVLLLAACRPALPPPDAGRLRVAVSVPPQRYFVERIGGRHVEVEVMIPPGYSHVDYPLTPRQLLALSRARLYVAVGHPAFEFERARIEPLLPDLPDLEVVDMSRGMRLLAGPGEGSEGHHHFGGAGGDPHVWVAPETVAVAARNIAAALERIDPAHAAEYRANLQRFEADIASLDREIRSRLAPAQGSGFLVYHPTWGYFAREYGLRQLAIEAEGKEPSAARLIQLIDGAKREGVKVVFVQSGFPRKSAQVIADAVGARVLVADPQDPDWLGNLRRVSRELEEALGPSPARASSGSANIWALTSPALLSQRERREKSAPWERRRLAGPELLAAKRRNLSSPGRQPRVGDPPNPIEPRRGDTSCREGCRPCGAGDLLAGSLPGAGAPGYSNSAASRRDPGASTEPQPHA
jgi:zinc transport system substrate-binding protein